MLASTKVRMALVGVAASALLTAAPALAEGGQNAVMKSGSCTGAATWKLKASPDNGKIEAQFEVDGIVAGQKWLVVLRDNGLAFFTGNRTAVAPADSFSVTRRTANQAGSDTIVGKATNTVTGQVCRGTVTL